MKRKLFVILTLLFCIPAFPKAQDGPIDTLATKETAALYRNLKNLGSSGFLFGHQDDLAYGVNWKYQKDNSDVKRTSGSYPALYGWELGRIEVDQAVNLDSVPFAKIRDFIRTGYKRGAAITISWHLNNPVTGKSAWAPSVPEAIQAVLPGGSANERYQGWLDRVAAFLTSLKDENGTPIPVILRLFHELNGDWFWWGAKNCSPADIKALWRYTVTYLRDKKQLHQLLYAFNTDRFDSESDYLLRYPGKEWVDVVGFDIYQANNISSNQAFTPAFERMLRLIKQIGQSENKIAALTEFGFNQLPDSTWWTSVFLPALKKYPVSYVMAWRNAGAKENGTSEFYVPFPGQASAADFQRFRQSGEPLFEEDAEKKHLYH